MELSGIEFSVGFEKRSRSPVKPFSWNSDKSKALMLERWKLFNKPASLAVSLPLLVPSDFSSGDCRESRIDTVVFRSASCREPWEPLVPLGFLPNFFPTGGMRGAHLNREDTYDGLSAQVCFVLFFAQHYLQFLSSHLFLGIGCMESTLSPSQRLRLSN